ncbi:penicillin-binding transpeptidase domain-containing protein [Granulicella sp. L46]|uniref:penicillin-binding transpeptidase domain-containing protein n=1 Tax=Granulicella sp. L46 TaxID=1641865 RepID=UPI00131B9326|nr:penicillin-binding transpeptidase domain-containing protein [Granulicella sp. L46]
MKETSRQKLTAPIRRVRFVYVAMFFCFWAGAIAVRLTWLQVVQHGTWVERAKQQQQRTFEVAPHRGVLYDRNMKALAMTVLVDSIYAVPSELGDNRADDAALLAKIVHADPLDGFTREKEIDARFNASKHFAWVARKVTPDIANRVQQLNLKGIYLQKEFKRFYPNGDLGSHVLGYVGTDDNGLGGLEAKFDDELHGEPGHEYTAIDAKRHVLGSDESDPIPGENLQLTIDSNIQYMAERALDAQMAKVKASHGTIVVQDPRTGQILALAVSPRFNPNDALHVDPQDLTDLAVSDVYEPGSTFKLVTYAAAVDAAGVKPTDMVDCQFGAMTMFGRTLHDDKSDRFGVVTVKYALEHSSDVGAAKMALKLGPDKFYKYMRGFGFGDRSGVELPSETRGLLAPPRKWGSTSILSMAIGQEVAVTPVQLVSMVSAIANGGVYLPPHILLQSSDALKREEHLGASPFHPGEGLPATLPDGAHRVITEATASTMREMMAGVVSEGTGKAAQLNGYSSAGKTGTAQKVDPVTHTYSHTKVVASFAGFAPVNNPAISVTVVIDQPTVGILYGAEVSAPVFREVAQEVLEYLGVPHDQALKTAQQMKEAQNTVEPDDVPDQHLGDLNAVFDEVNSLPADDPLRQPANAAAMAENRNADEAFEEAAKAKPKPVGLEALPDKVLDAIHKHGGASALTTVAAVDRNESVAAPLIRPQVQVRDNGAVVVDPGKRVAVPDFHGNDLRMVVERAGGLRLRVRTLGSGLAQEQAPLAGTMVPLGTEIVVRFMR